MTAAAFAAPAASAAPNLPPWLLAGLTAALRATPEAVADVRGNVAPPAPDMAGSLANGLDYASAFLPALVTELRTHQGEVTAAAHILDALAGAGVPYAAEVRQWVLETPGAAEAAEVWLAHIKELLATFAPAATGIQGDDHTIGRG